MLDVIAAFCAGGLFGFLVLGYRVRQSMKQLEEFDLEFPIDSTISFVLYDRLGHQLTERTLVSVGGDGANARQITAPVIKSGQIHHGVIFMGEYGSLIDDIQPTPFVTEGDLYVIGAGNWHMQLDTPSE